MADLTSLAAETAAAHAELRAGDLTAYDRAVKSARKLRDETDKLLGCLPDDLYRAQVDHAYAEDRTRR